MKTFAERRKIIEEYQARPAITKKETYKHFIIICFAYAYFGFGLAVQSMGIKAGLGLYPTIIIYSTSVLVFMAVGFTSMQIVKDFIKSK